MKPANVTSSTHIDFVSENNYKDSKFRIGDHVRISKYKKKFQKDTFQIYLKKAFVIKKVKNTVASTYVIKKPKWRRNCWNVL